MKEPMIEQKIIYVYNGKSYDSRKDADAAARDVFGEEMDVLFREADLSHRFKLSEFNLVLEMWERREKLARLLATGYQGIDFYDLCEGSDDEND